MRRLSRVLTLFLITILTLFVGCEGPAGEQGPQGPKGEQGPVGPAGDDGSKIYSRQGTPSNSKGSNGDYYLDISTGEMYGPKNDQGWGTPISLQGPAGQDGKDGSQIYSGSSAPQSSLGKEGDYYLNKSTFDLYGPKTANSWGTPINLKGTANVMYSSWVNPPQWNGSTQTTTKYRYFDISANAMTQDIIDKGIVKVYTNFNTPSVYSLPLAKAGSPGNPNYSYFFQLNPQQLRIAYMNPDATGTLPNALGTSSEFRYVLIPGGKHLKTKAKAGELPIDLNDYEQVKRYFGIPK
ncbi:collagen-like protein [Fodinibius halophilus]|uniref:Collagen-like protein n=1 Tax=Fodinibius halophilus TaxID=1736908 RepID=A0A6M1TBB6_9BACT|nr:collagen-like protein [Fodinibius halophilus]NGP88234.1 collagen-like protein [Fodinibius halophilus]